MVEKSVEKVWKEFWLPLVTDGNGNVDMDKIKNELSDYRMILDNVSKVYDHLTGGRVSKPNTLASAVIGEAEKYREEILDDYKQELIAFINE